MHHIINNVKKENPMKAELALGNSSLGLTEAVHQWQ